MTDTPYAPCPCGCGEARAHYRVEDCGYESSCWVWQRSTVRGYGQIQVDGVGKRAHRHYYERHKGPIPEGLDLDHLCRNPSCVNPAHLEPVTRKENVRRGLNVALKTECRQGHPWIPENLLEDEDGHRRCRICRTAKVARDDQARIQRRRDRPLTPQQQRVFDALARRGSSKAAALGNDTGIRGRELAIVLRWLRQCGLAERDGSRVWHLTDAARANC